MAPRNPRPVRVLRNAEVARDSRWLVLKIEDEEPVGYLPGKVISIILRDERGRPARRPYTVSRCDPGERTVSVLYRVIHSGYLTSRLAALGEGDTLEIRGSFGTPISEAMHPSCQAFVGVSTGTGVGPLFGFAEQLLDDGSLPLPVRLLTGYRDSEDICFAEELRSLKAIDSQFTWYPSLSQPSGDWSGLRGRVNVTLPLLIQLPLHRIHFHLIGNGRMVNTVRAALDACEVPSKHVSFERYFNRLASPVPSQVAGLRDALLSLR